jgi:hypothetical protein
MNQIAAGTTGLVYGSPPFQDHHGSALWLKDAQGWFLVRNLAGIEWSAQFCADPAKVDLLRQNAKRLYDLLAPEIKQELDPGGLLDTPIQDAAGVAKWTDSIFNAGVPLQQSFHTGVLPQGGAHSAQASAPAADDSQDPLDPAPAADASQGAQASARWLKPGTIARIVGEAVRRRVLVVIASKAPDGTCRRTTRPKTLRMSPIFVLRLASTNGTSMAFHTAAIWRCRRCGTIRKAFAPWPSMVFSPPSSMWLRRDGTLPRRVTAHSLMPARPRLPATRHIPT